VGRQAQAGPTFFSLSRERQPTRARPRPPPSFLFLRAAQPTTTAAQPSQTPQRPFTFRPGQLTSGARLSAFPSSSRCAPQLPLLRPATRRRTTAPSPFRLRHAALLASPAYPAPRLSPLRDTGAKLPRTPENPSLAPAAARCVPCSCDTDAGHRRRPYAPKTYRSV
jgi:hypothetical protein